MAPDHQHQLWRSGYCEVTQPGEGKDCLPHDTKGAFVRLWGGSDISQESCVERCRACAQCRFVSFSASQGDCSWFSSCQLSKLGSAHGTDHRTVRVREVAAAPAKPQTFVYNRVGKAGSSSVVAWLRRWCKVKEVKVKSAFSADASVRRTALMEDLAKLQRKRVSPCNVLAGHFRYVALPNASYINVLRHPIDRWLSMRDFYVRMGYGKTSWPISNLTHCLEHFAPSANTTTSCLPAADAQQAAYFFESDEERDACDVRAVSLRYSFLTTLDQILALPRLKTHLTLTSHDNSIFPWELNSMRPKKERANRLLPVHRTLLAKELACDFALFRLATADRSRPLLED